MLADGVDGTDGCQSFFDNNFVGLAEVGFDRGILFWEIRLAEQLWHSREEGRRIVGCRKAKCGWINID
jgi:hypothetical protein